MKHKTGVQRTLVESLSDVSDKLAGRDALQRLLVFLVDDGCLVVGGEQLLLQLLVRCVETLVRLCVAAIRFDIAAEMKQVPSLQLMGINRGSSASTKPDQRSASLYALRRRTTSSGSSGFFLLAAAS